MYIPVVSRRVEKRFRVTREEERPGSSFAVFATSQNVASSVVSRESSRRRIVR